MSKLGSYLQAPETIVGWMWLERMCLAILGQSAVVRKSKPLLNKSGFFFIKFVQQ